MSYPACSLCEGSGIVPVDRRIDDQRVPRGCRTVFDVYRCRCTAGDKHPKLRLAPRPEREYGGEGL